MSHAQIHETVSPSAGPRYGRWVYGLVVIPPVAAVLTVLLAPDPHGHWSEHLGSAYFGIAQLGLLVVLAGLLGRRMLSVALLIAVAVVAFGIVCNFQVASSIWRTPGDPGFGTGYAQGHEHAETGDLLVIVGGAGFAFIAGLTRRVRLKIAGLALVMVVIPPPWLWPAAGVLVLLLHGLRSHNASAPASDPAQAPLS
jgi:hypothetical protein